MRPASAPAGTAIEVVRAAHPGPALAVTVLMAALTVASGLPTWVALTVVAAVAAGQLSIGWSNDLIDAERDRRAGRADKPLATGRATASTVRRACAVAVAACVALSLACGPVAGALHLTGVAAGWAYNLGVKSTVWSWVPYAVAFGVWPVFVGIAGGGPGLPWWTAVTGALLGVGAHLLNVLPDLADDAATGVHGLPHRLGARRAALLAVVLLVLASVVVVVASSSGRPGPAGGAGLAVVAVLAAVALTTSGRTPFRAAMAIALVDVVLLVGAL